MEIGNCNIHKPGDSGYDTPENKKYLPVGFILLLVLFYFKYWKIQSENIIHKTLFLYRIIFKDKKDNI